MDYKQPKFYQFNEDSFLLIAEVIKDCKHPIKSLLDVGAGCGVIGIELAIKLNLERVVLLEKQKAFLESLEYNLNDYLDIKTEIIHKSIEETNMQDEFDLIVSNPPYFRAGHGRVSPINEKQISRTFTNQMNISKWIECCLSYLKSDGFLYIICHQDSYRYLKAYNYKVLNERADIKILKILNE